VKLSGLIQNQVFTDSKENPALLKQGKIYLKTNLMKNIISFLILGCLSLYGFSINPTNPSAKAGEAVNTITAQSPFTTKECSDLYSLVPVTVSLTINDCPFDCIAPCASFSIRLTDGTNYYGTQTWNGGCSYYFDNLRIEEYTYIWVEFYNSGACTVVWNSNTSNPVQVPSGGGNLTSSMDYCP